MAIVVRPYTPNDRPKWDDFVRQSPFAHFAQRSAWKILIEQQYNFEASYWIAWDGQDIAGIMPLFKSGRIAFSAPGGLLAGSSDAAAALIDIARDLQDQRKLRYVEFRDQQTLWFDLPTNTEHCTMVLDLPDSEETLWKSISGTLRNEIRRAQKNGLTTAWNRERSEDFYKVYSENMRDLGTPVRSYKYYKAVIEALRTDADLLFVMNGEETMATMLLVGQSETLYDPWASALRRFFQLRPNQLLYWEALRSAIGRKYKRFDFGRSQWDSGTFRFKAQWGARPVQLNYQYLLADGISMPSFEEQKQSIAWAVELWKRLPLPLARVAGEPIRRRLTEVL